MKRRLLAVVLACASPAAGAQDFHAQGFLELRLPWPMREDRSWTEGGLGKLRFGDGDDSLAAGRRGVAVLAAFRLPARGRRPAGAGPDLAGTRRDLRLAALAPVSDLAWRWSLRAGAFFPPVSLEKRRRRLDQPLDAHAFRASTAGSARSCARSARRRGWNIAACTAASKAASPRSSGTIPPAS
jgi:hypothetical protein